MIDNDNTPVRAEITTDGSCIPNPGPGGWAALLQAFDADGIEVIRQEISGRDSDATNNRMELTAVKEALRAATGLSGLPVLVRTDSDYVRLGLTKWLPGWQARGWRKSNGKAPENRDLWQALTAETVQFPLLTFEYVKAHSGDERNEWADSAAKAQAELAQADAWAA